jgi:L-lactate dehydrogenase complex protein LldG
MSLTREAFLNRVRASERGASESTHYPLPELPLFDAPPGNRIERFCASLAAMGGKYVRIDSAGALAAWYANTFPGATALTATPQVTFVEALDTGCPPAALHEVDVGIVRARYGVAETGSVWLSEAEYGVNALGYLAQHLVVLLDPADIVDGLQDIYRLPDFGHASYAVLVTGPSATADIEGVLIRGAQGVRSLTVVLLERY